MRLEFLRLARYKLQKLFGKVNLDVVNLIREKDIEYLSNAYLLETDLLPKLGINNEGNNKIHWLPEKLSHFNNGLRIWQYPNQFSKYLVFLSHMNLHSYMEIGVRHGGSFITTVEYLNRFNPIKAVGVDIHPSYPLIDYQYDKPNIDFVMLDSHSNLFKKFIEGEMFDLIFIDGDHSEEGCWKDFLAVKDNAKMIAFHDIVASICPGVVNVWNRLKKEYSKEYDFYEFSEQYWLNGKFMGIGVMVRKVRK